MRKQAVAVIIKTINESGSVHENVIFGVGSDSDKRSRKWETRKKKMNFLPAIRL
jgi:hypothetical protein